jgi:hypothetical protein
MDDVAKEALAVFVSKRFLWRDSWTLYTDTLACRSTFLGITYRRKNIKLSMLYLGMCNTHVYKSTIITNALCAAILIVGQLVGQFGSMIGLPWHTRFHPLICWSVVTPIALFYIAKAISPSLFFIIGGQCPIRIKHAWWEYSKAKSFCEQVLAQIAEQPEHDWAKQYYS